MWLLGILALGAAGFVGHPEDTVVVWWELGVFVLIAALAGRAKIPLMPHARDEDTGSISLGFALIFAALLRFGPLAGMLVGLASTLSSCLFPKRQPLHQLTFNLALNALETFLCGMTLVNLNVEPFNHGVLGPFPAVIAATLVFFLVDTFAIAAVIALCSGQPTFATWKETFLWTAPSFFAGAGVSTAALLLFGASLGTLLLFLAPVVFLTHQLYALYTTRARERQQYIERLQQSEARLAAALERERQIAGALQHSFLIGVPDGTFPGLSVQTRYEAASDEALIGGDFYDAFALPGGRVGLVVGDASGKGLAAAVRIAQIKYALRAYAHESAGPGAALARLNDFECGSQEREDRPFGSFVVLSLAIIDTATGEAVISSAGTEPPLILRSTGDATVVNAGGMPLGVEAGETYTDSCTRLAPGDTVAIVTDGITEARHQRQIFGYERFMRLAVEAHRMDSLPEVARAIMDGARGFARGKFQDDACLLLARWSGAPCPAPGAGGPGAADPFDLARLQGMLLAEEAVPGP